MKLHMHTYVRTTYVCTYYVGTYPIFTVESEMKREGKPRVFQIGIKRGKEIKGRETFRRFYCHWQKACVIYVVCIHTGS